MLNTDLAGVAQLAFLGYITTEFGYRLPGAISLDGTTFESIPSGFAAIYAMPGAGLAQIVAFAGYLEFFGWKQNPNSFPGDFSASSFPVGFLDGVAKSEDAKTKLRAQELNQGRAAMMGYVPIFCCCVRSSKQLICSSNIVVLDFLRSQNLQSYDSRRSWS